MKRGYQCGFGAAISFRKIDHEHKIRVSMLRLGQKQCDFNTTTPLSQKQKSLSAAVECFAGLTMPAHERAKRRRSAAMGERE